MGLYAGKFIYEEGGVAVFVCGLLLGALMSGLFGLSLWSPLAFAGALTSIGLTRANWRTNFQHVGGLTLAARAPAAGVLCFALACVWVGIPYSIGLGIRALLGH